jgi:hypothetical protein
MRTSQETLMEPVFVGLLLLETEKGRLDFRNGLFIIYSG